MYICPFPEPSTNVDMVDTNLPKYKMMQVGKQWNRMKFQKHSINQNHFHGQLRKKQLNSIIKVLFIHQLMHQ